MATLKDILGDKYKEGMTAEEINAVLSGIDIHAGYVTKATLDSATTDAADWKRKYLEKLTDEEKQKQATEEMVKELNTLKREKSISEHANSLIATGYSAELAKSTAEAIIDGKFDVFLANQAKFIADRDAAQKKKGMDDMTPPPGGGKGDTVTKEQFAKMTIAERTELYEKSPELYKELTK